MLIIVKEIHTRGSSRWEKINIPSLSPDQCRRETIENNLTQQNSQKFLSYTFAK
jgi:hypothetical protein